MTRRTNARIAGFTFLFYIATGITSLILFSRATAGAEGTAATLAAIAGHATLVRLTVVLTLIAFGCAVVLGVTLYALTRDEDPDLAMIAMCCRVGEGVVAAASSVRTLGLVSVAAAGTAATGADAAATLALGASLLSQNAWSGSIAAACFSVGSTIFAWLFLRARSIPVPLAWLGVLGSLLLVVAIPLQLAGFLRGPVTYFIWIPIALFEVVLALWLLIKGVTPPALRATPPGEPTT